MTTDFGLFAPCHYHRVCGNVVIPGETVCEQCRTDWGALLRPITPAPAARESEPHSLARSELRLPDPDRKASQICWMCEHRRTCNRIEGRWECDTCRTIT